MLQPNYGNSIHAKIKTPCRPEHHINHSHHLRRTEPPKAPAHRYPALQSVPTLLSLFWAAGHTQLPLTIGDSLCLVIYMLCLPSWFCLPLYSHQHWPNLSFLLFHWLIFWDSVSICSPGWPQTSYLPASTSQLWGFQVCITTPDSHSVISIAKSWAS
jgi:hypothetical protein